MAFRILKHLLAQTLPQDGAQALSNRETPALFLKKSNSPSSYFKAKLDLYHIKEMNSQQFLETLSQHSRVSLALLPLDYLRNIIDKAFGEQNHEPY